MENHRLPIQFDQDIRILRASLRDLNPLRELETLCFPLDAWPLLDMIGVLTLPQTVRFKAEKKRELVGFVAGDIRRFQNTGWIATICVHPDLRGQGLGRALLGLCETEMGMPKVRLSVRKSNQAALEMYERAGYEQIGRWPRYYVGGEDALVFEKVLR